MADTLTRYLKLKIADDLSADAKYNLQRIDSLGASIGSTFVTGLGDKLNILSRGDIQLVAKDSSIGGPGSGGTITFGDSSNLATVVIEGSSFLLNCGLSLKNSAISANNYLTVSFLNAVNLTTPQSLTIGVGSGNRSITFPLDGAVVTTAGVQTITDKTISGSDNTLSNIGYSSLILANSIVNSDIASNANIATSKISGPLTDVIGSGLGMLAGKNTADLTSDVTGILPTANGGTGTNGSDRATALLNLLPLLAGNEAATLRVNPTGTGIEWVAGAGQGTVTSVGMAVPSEWAVTTNNPSSPSSITSSGIFTISKAVQSANTVYSAPNGTSGEPTFRFLVEADIPSLGQGKIANLISDLAGKQATITGAASTITATDLTVSRALQSNSSGKVEVSSVTSTELGYLSGVTSGIQTQLGGKEPSITAGTTSQYWRGDKTWYSPVINSTAGNETDQAASVAALKSYVAAQGGGAVSYVWNNADGTTKSINHALNKTTVSVTVYDENGEDIFVDVIDRVDANNLSLTASVAPPGAAPTGNWTVIIRP